MPEAQDPIHPDQVHIRTYEPSDQPAVSHLYVNGLLAGQIPTNDTGADIEMIEEAYLNAEKANFWVAVYEDRVVGMVGVAEDEPNVAEVRRLRVENDLQARGIGRLLLEAALGFCRHHGYLKVRLDTRIEKDTASDMFDRFGFQHHRSRDVPGKELLEFYLDLYRDPKPEEEG
jgi:N-acetylglutamate synthase-like GNAT family acetyltransferase